MKLDSIVTLEISESKLINWLHNTHSNKSLDEIMEWLATPEGDAALSHWIDTQSGVEFDELDDSSYSELIDYIENNF